MHQIGIAKSKMQETFNAEAQRTLRTSELKKIGSFIFSAQLCVLCVSALNDLSALSFGNHAKSHMVMTLGTQRTVRAVFFDAVRVD